MTVCITFNIYLTVESETAEELTIIHEEDYVRDASLDLVLAGVKEASLQEYKASQVNKSSKSNLLIFTSI